MRVDVIGYVSCTVVINKTAKHSSKCRAPVKTQRCAISRWHIARHPTSIFFHHNS